MSAVLDQPRDQGNDSPQHSDQWAITPRSLVIGALIALVLLGLWQARPHLKEVLHKAWNRDAPVDDSREIMSYRAAVLCFLGGVIFIFFWLWESGIPAWIAPLFILAALVIMIGLARVVAEAGVPTWWTHSQV